MIRLITIYFIAFGITLGGTFLAGFSALLTRQAPFELMKDVAQDLKFWAIIAAIGGTFDALKGIEEGFLGGQYSSLLRQIFYFFAAFFGANTASGMILMLIRSLSS